MPSTLLNVLRDGPFAPPSFVSPVYRGGVRLRDAMQPTAADAGELEPGAALLLLHLQRLST